MCCAFFRSGFFIPYQLSSCAKCLNVCLLQNSITSDAFIIDDRRFKGQFQIGSTWRQGLSVEEDAEIVSGNPVGIRVLRTQATGETTRPIADKADSEMLWITIIGGNLLNGLHARCISKEYLHARNGIIIAILIGSYGITDKHVFASRQTINGLTEFSIS